MFALPNALTIMRIVLVPVFAVAFVMPGDAARMIAFFVFALAGVSDWLDGLPPASLKPARISAACSIPSPTRYWSGWR